MTTWVDSCFIGTKCRKTSINVSLQRTGPECLFMPQPKSVTSRTGTYSAIVSQVL
ncbi:hypothetical protein JOB18_036675 [Solea senegalensis]|uniref:Uncharacterized protein n=1 Tax=Solea senegalensis TaxID=28829 RepID=A0AAV6PT26_SOLSE|nr:hypothetical protein JOB18_036675 [Solea senegalensis]